MSDSGSANSNSWTLLSQEENVATLRPLVEGTDPHEESSYAAESQPPDVATPAKTEHPVEEQQASEENVPGQCEGEASPGIAQHPSPTHTPPCTPNPDLSTETPPPPSPSSVIPAHSPHGSDAHSQSEGLPEGPVESASEPDSFSDSYTHISPSSPDEPPIPELLGGLELTEEEEEADRRGSEEEGCERGLGLGSSVDPQAGEERGRDRDGEAEGDSEVRKRSLLASLEQIGRREEEEVEEEFQLPRRHDDSGFSVNKCILGAVILLGLGAIFFSGVFMDLDEENDYASRDPRDTEQPFKKEWQKPEVPQAPVDEGMEILNMLVKETQQIAELHAKKEELNAAEGQAAEGAQEQLRRRTKEEVEEEKNVDTARLPAHETASTAPPAGQAGEGGTATAGGGEAPAEKPRRGEGAEQTPERRKEKRDAGHSEGRGDGGTDRRERAQNQRKDEEGKRPGRQQQQQQEEEERRGGEVKGWKREGEEKERRRAKEERGHGKKDRGHRGDEGEPWKDRGDGGAGGRGEEKEEEGRKDRKEEHKWKKGKHDRLEGERDGGWKGQEKEEKKKGKDRGDGWKEGRGKEEERNGWKEEKESKKGKEEKEWKRGKEERNGWKEEKESKRGKEERNGWKKEKESKRGKEERNGWKEEKESKRGKEERNGWKEEKEFKRGKEEKEWKRGKEERKDRKSDEWGRDRETESRGHEEQRRDGAGRKQEQGKWKQEKEEWKGEKHWKNEKDAHRDGGREGKEKNEWREKGEQKEWQDRRGQKDKESRRERQGKEEKGSWQEKEERRSWEKRERQEEGKAKREARKDGRKDTDWKQDRKPNSGRDHETQEQHHHHHHHKETLWQGRGDGKPAHSHTRRRPSFGQPEYWAHQKERLRHNALPSRHCDSVQSCAQAEGTVPVRLAEFEALLAGYLAKAEQGPGVDAAAAEEVRKLAAGFFEDGVFAHDKMSFRDYLEDLSDVLEDMVDGDDGEGEEDREEDNSDLEDEMEMFGREAMKRFAAEEPSEKTERKTGRPKVEGERARG